MLYDYLFFMVKMNYPKFQFIFITLENHRIKGFEDNLSNFIRYQVSHKLKYFHRVDVAVWVLMIQRCLLLIIISIDICRFCNKIVHSLTLADIESNNYTMNAPTEVALLWERTLFFLNVGNMVMIIYIQLTCWWVKISYYKIMRFRYYNTIWLPM